MSIKLFGLVSARRDGKKEAPEGDQAVALSAYDFLVVRNRLAGEAKRPQQTFPKALFSAGIITCRGYLIPLLAGVGALDVGQEQWMDGFLANAAGIITRKWLKYWDSVASILSVVGLFKVQLSVSSYQLLGMANLEFLP
ncbi:hypothetical protein MRB53_015765 [Persea americana]|uniref:Uncharacterized protein n=1 Tax=Persea americana TaxID=3435 RepID=A0ACC2LZY9_PERAE|nr:hypothetical protein MRB53_015765 [Persea americana]